jgi:hypothetical protein
MWGAVLSALGKFPRPGGKYWHHLPFCANGSAELKWLPKAPASDWRNWNLKAGYLTVNFKRGPFWLPYKKDGGWVVGYRVGSVVPPSRKGIFSIFPILHLHNSAATKRPASVPWWLLRLPVWAQVLPAKEQEGGGLLPVTWLVSRKGDPFPEAPRGLSLRSS